MKLNLQKEELEKLKKLLEMNENNYNVSEAYNHFYYHLARNIKSNDLKVLMELNHLEEKEAYFYQLMSILKIDISDLESLQLAKSYFFSGINPLNTKDYLDNPYLKNIKFNKNTMKNIKIEYDEYLPFEGFPSNDLIVDEDNYFQERYQLGYFKEKFPFQSITHDNITWMSIIPNEIETMKEAIKIVTGKVLVYGLGLGYFPYMISLKEDVKEIVIIEKDPNIIKIFKDNILPQFKFQSKIKIINQDAFSFEKNSPEHFDYAFVDLYHGDYDGIEIYVKFKQLELRSDNYLYWLEKTLINVIRRNLITILYGEYLKVDCNYTIAKNFNDKLINALYHLIENKTFSSYQEIQNLLREESILKLIKQIKII